MPPDMTGEGALTEGEPDWNIFVISGDYEFRVIYEIIDNLTISPSLGKRKSDHKVSLRGSTTHAVLIEQR